MRLTWVWLPFFFYAFCAVGAEPIDVIFVVHPKDMHCLNFAITGIKKYGKGIRNVYCISQAKLTNQATWFDEKKYPFTKKSIALEILGNEEAANEYLASPKSRIGWIYQQFLKLYAPFVIPNISSNVLTVDADIVFLKPVCFIDDDGNALYNVGLEYFPGYFEHGARLIPGFKRVYPESSGIAHHMLFQRSVLEKMFALIRKTHNVEPWRAICRCIDKEAIYHSSLSEYELYFNFLFADPNKKAKIRRLSWIDVPASCAAQDTIDLFRYLGQDYIACHSYIE